MVTPAARGLQGIAPEKFLPARSVNTLEKGTQLCFFAKARATVNANAELEVELLPGQESFKIAPLVVANCWAIIESGRSAVVAGELIDIAPLVPGRFLQAD